MFPAAHAAPGDLLDLACRHLPLCVEAWRRARTIRHCGLDGGVGALDRRGSGAFRRVSHASDRRVRRRSGPAWLLHLAVPQGGQDVAIVDDRFSPSGSVDAPHQGPEAGPSSLGLCRGPGMGWIPSVGNNRTWNNAAREADEAQRTRAVLEQLLEPLGRDEAAGWADTLMEAFGSVATALGAQRSQLKQLLGADAPADYLNTIHHCMRWALRESALSRPVLSSSTALLDYLRLDLANETVEVLRVLLLDTRNCLLDDRMLARGAIDQVVVCPREIVRAALNANAAAVILVHNHPSGNPQPSRADIDVSRRVASAAALFGIALHDHLIVGRTACVSLAAMGLLAIRA